MSYSVDVGNGVMRSPLAKDKLIENNDDGYYDVFLRAIEKSNDGPYLGTLHLKTLEFQWLKYSEVKEMVSKAGSALEFLTSKKSNIGIYALNRKEWTITELGCVRNNLVTIPLYDTLGKEAIVHIINETEMKLCILAGNRISAVIDAKNEGLLGCLKILVSMDDVEDSLRKRAEASGLAIHSWSEFLKIGTDHPTDESGKSTNSDVFTICYTSGTSGMPKGVVMTHRIILSIARCVEFMGEHKTIHQFSKNDVHLSYLPLAHVFERVLQVLLLQAGAQVGFYRGDPLKILEDIQILKPTIFVSVPRLFNRIYDKISQGVAEKSGVAKFLFNAAFASKKKGLAKNKVTHWFWDKLVFGGIRKKLGFINCQTMISGSAPISGDVLQFLRIVFSCPVLEGYGQTESAGGVTTSHLGDTSVGHVGGPVPCIEIKLVDLPEMSYLTTDKPFPRGEICYRGANAFAEYFKSPEKTKETIDTDGWIHTGDVGLFDDMGRLKIIDRAKNIFKLAQGEYIAPEKIENVYIKHPLVAQMFCTGISLKPSLVAIVVPDKDMFVKWAKQNKFPGEFEEQLNNEVVQNAFFKDIDTFARNSELCGFECVRSIALEKDMFSVENELLTPTFKLKRFEAKKKYANQIDAMYEALEK